MSSGMRIAVAADLHNSDSQEIIALIKESRPDIIVCPGDLFGSLADDRCRGDEPTGRYIAEAAENEKGFAFLREAGRIAPVFCSVGNHEVRVSAENAERIARTGATLLDNSHITLPNGTLLGGLSTGGAYGLFHKSGEPNLSWLNDFARLKAQKILLSHHPEYWERHIIGKDIDLTISGHAHGGQWCFFGRGLLAPGQGFFPKYTSGVYKKKGQIMVVSRGLRLECGIPRINNLPEVVIVKIE